MNKIQTLFYQKFSSLMQIISGGILVLPIFCKWVITWPHSLCYSYMLYMDIWLLRILIGTCRNISYSLSARTIHPHLCVLKLVYSVHAEVPNHLSRIRIYICFGSHLRLSIIFAVWICPYVNSSWNYFLTNEQLSVFI